MSAAVLTASADAAAQWPGYCGSGPASNGHWYSIIVGQGSGETAAQGEFVSTNLLAMANPSGSSGFVDHEMWYGLDTSASTWVEVGVLEGLTTSDGITTTPSVFWADQNCDSSSCFHQHIVSGTVTLGDWYGEEITGGDCTWTVKFGGNTIGTSVDNCAGSGRWLAAGIESMVTGTGTSDVGATTFWLQENNSSTWSYWSFIATEPFWCYEPSDIQWYWFDTGFPYTGETLHGPL
jgi:hypothetical protein